MKNNNSYKLPLALVFSLFFLWAISSNLLPTMIRQLMKTCELNTFEASFTETAYWLAYFIFPIPIAMFMKRYSYKAGIIFGLVLSLFYILQESAPLFAVGCQCLGLFLHFWWQSLHQIQMHQLIPAHAGLTVASFPNISS